MKLSVPPRPSPPCGPAPAFDLCPLEPRVLMSAAAWPVAPAPTVAPATMTQPVRAVAPAAPALARSYAVTASDRLTLLQHWVGPGVKTLRRLLNAGDAAGFDRQLLANMAARTKQTYFFTPAQVDGYVAYDKANTPYQVQRTVAYADQILAGLFPVQATSQTYGIQLPHDFSWTSQPTTTKNPLFLYGLNRQQFWLKLAMAYRFTGDARYADELIRQLGTWSQQVRPLDDPDATDEAGPGWNVLTASARVDVWTECYQLLVNTPAWNARVNTLFLYELYLHGDFLARVTPPDDPTSNHTIIQAKSLAEVGTVFPEFKDAAAWQKAGTALLFRSMDAQLYPDGGQDEQSPGYQSLVVEDLLDPYLLARVNGQAWPKPQVARLHNSADSLYQLLHPDGSHPALSDTYRTSALLTISHAALVLDEPAWPVTSTRLGDIFLLGRALTDRTLGASQAPTLAGRGLDYAMPDSGYYVTRSGEDRAARQIILDAGPTGKTHGHLDLLSFELYGYGKPLIADPGVVTYDDSADRRWVVGTPAHNTISLDGKSHEAEEGLGNEHIVVDAYKASTDSVRWTAHHTAYAGLAGAPVVGRSVWYDRGDTMLVVDYAKASKSHTFTSSFNLAGANVTGVSAGTIRTADPWGNVMVQTLLLPGQTAAARKSFISSNPPPDEKSPATRYAVSQTGAGAVIANLVLTYPGPTPPQVSAAWATLPAPGRDGVIRLTENGVSRLIAFPTPKAFARLSVASVPARAAGGTVGTLGSSLPPSVFSARLIAGAGGSEAEPHDGPSAFLASPGAE